MHIFGRRKTVAMSRVGTAFHSLAPKGRGWGEGVTMIPYRTAGAPSSRPSPAEVGFIRLRPCLVAKSGRPDFARGEGVRDTASLTATLRAALAPLARIDRCR